MDVSAIVKAIDDRIAALQQAKALLSSTAVSTVEKHVKEAFAASRPRAGKTVKAAAEPVRGRKPMSAEGRARIAAAQKKRWALQHATAKKAAKTAGPPAPAAAKKSAAKKAPARKIAAKSAPVVESTGTESTEE